MSKPNIEPHIKKALLILTGNDPTVTVERRLIMDHVMLQIKGILGYPQSKAKLENLITSTLSKLRSNHEIGYEGRNKYKIVDSLVETTPTKPAKVPPEYFPEPSKKRRLPESFTNLDPAAKRRYATSSSSVSGDEFQKTVKKFHGQKKIVRPKPNPPLPGARQVQSDVAGLNVCLPSTSFDSTMPIEKFHAQNSSSASSEASFLGFPEQTEAVVENNTNVNQDGSSSNIADDEADDTYVEVVNLQYQLHHQENQADNDNNDDTTDDNTDFYITDDNIGEDEAEDNPDYYTDDGSEGNTDNNSGNSGVNNEYEN